MDAAWRGGVCEVKCEQGGGALSSASDAGNTTLPGGNTRLHWTVGPSPVSIGTLSIWLWGGLGDPVTGSVFVVTGGGAGEVSLRRVARPLAMADVGSSSSPAHETRLFRAAMKARFFKFSTGSLRGGLVQPAGWAVLRLPLREPPTLVPGCRPARVAHVWRQRRRAVARLRPSPWGWGLICAPVFARRLRPKTVL